jgi:hypothetical protein
VQLDIATVGCPLTTADKRHTRIIAKLREVMMKILYPIIENGKDRNYAER